MAKRKFETKLGVERSKEPSRKRGRWTILILITILLAAVIWWAFQRKNAVEQLPPTAEVRLTSYPGIETTPSFSPDGMKVAFAWNAGEEAQPGSIYVKTVGESGPPVRVTGGTAEDDFPVWSPDGNALAFRRRSGNAYAICLASPSGGSERKLADVQGLAVGISWSPGGRYIAGGEWIPGVSSKLFLISLERGERRELISRDPPVFNAVGAFSPNGRYLAYTTHTGEQTEDLYLLEFRQDHSLKGPPRRLTSLGGVVRGVAWAQDGRSVIYSRSATADADAYLWRVKAFESGNPERVDVAGPRAAWPAVARKGNRLVFRRGGVDYETRRFETGGKGGDQVFSSEPDMNPQFSPDGRFIAFASRREDGRNAIWVSNADGTNARRLTRGSEGRQSYPSWSPDGQLIAYDAAGESGTQDVYVIEARGGEPRRLTQDGADDNLPAWSRDGKWVYFHSNRRGRSDIMRAPVEGGVEERVTANGGGRPMVSHDGRTLYYYKPVQGSASVPLYAMPVEGGPERKVLDSTLAWGYWVGEKEIYYFGSSVRRGEYPFYLCPVAGGQSRLLGNVKGRLARDPVVSPNGKTVLYSIAASPRMDLVLIEGFK